MKKLLEPVFIESADMGKVSALINSMNDEVECQLLYQSDAETLFEGNLKINNPLVVHGTFGYRTCLNGSLLKNGGNIREEGSYSIIKFMPNYVIEGKYKNEQLEFDQVVFCIQDFSEWLRMRRQESKSGEEELTVVSVSRKNDTINKLSVDEFDLEFGLNINIEHSKSDTYFRNKGFVKVKLKEKKSLGEVEEIITKLRYFLMLFIEYKMPYIEEVSVSNYVEINSDEDYFTNQPKELYVRNLNVLSDAQGISLGGCLYTFPDIQEQFLDMLKEWLELYDEIKLPLDKFAYASYTKEIPIDSRFKETVIALESLHKSVEKYKNGKIEETSLTNRLKDIFQQLGMIEDESIRENIAKKCVKTRNFYSHLIDKNEDIFNSYEMVEIIPILKEAFTNYILINIGIEKIKSRAYMQIDELIKKMKI